MIISLQLFELKLAITLEASHMILEFDLTRNMRWHSSKTVNSTLLRTSPCKTVALSKSSQRCRVVSRSLIGPLIGTSAGPHSTYSSTDFVLESVSDRSWSSKCDSIGVNFVSGSSSLMAMWAHWQRVPICSSSSRVKSWLTLKMFRLIKELLK